MVDRDVAEKRGVSEDIVRRLRVELGNSLESIEQMPERVWRRCLEKLEVPNRPQARINHERAAALGDADRILDDAVPRARNQLAQIRSGAADIARESAGIPAGTGLFSIDARSEGPTAGLRADNTGWTSLGPGNIGGRTRALVIDPSDANRIFAAGVAGGVWRSTDGGATWVVTDDLMANLAVCSLVMDPNDSNTLYAGTGEGFSNVDAVRGDGIFKTTDGSTWTPIASTSANPDFFYVNSLAISSDGQIILAGTMTGIFRSVDAAHEVWTKVLSAPIGNLVFDPTDSNKAIAGRLQDGRAYYTTDGGATWQEATRPTMNGGRVQVCYAAADPSITFASVDGPNSQIWRSTDGGQTYVSRATTSNGIPANILGQQGWYDNVIWVGDPTNSDLVLVGGIDLWKSTDGGNTLTPISTWWDDQSAHADHHAIVADPGYDGSSNRRVYFGNDGGIYKTENVATVGNNPTAPYTNGWVNLNNGYAVTQFYYGAGHIGTNTIIGGTQDNGTLRYTPAAGTNGWNKVYGGDGGAVGSNRTDPQIWYGEYVYLQVFRNTDGGASSTNSEYICGKYWNGFQWVWKPAPYTIPDAENNNAQFIAPFVLDPNDSNTMLGGGLSLWRTTGATTPNTVTTGPTWSQIKPAIGASVWNHAITAIAVAPSNSNLILVGHRNGNVYKTTNGKAENPQWQQIDTNGIGANRQCLSLTIDPDDEDVYYATFAGYQGGNLWKTSDGGQSWTDISGNLPQAPMRRLMVHPQRSAWLYLATDVGIFASENSGTTWSPTNEGPANVACRDLFWIGCELVCATHGRGMFAIDLAIADAFPAPQLVLKGTEDYTIQGNEFTRYLLTVTNRDDYPISLFFPSPDLPPCGQNVNASRTWVDIYNSDSGQRIYGFCAFDSPDDLDRIWFAVPKGSTPPSSVYITLRDRRCGAVYRSNTLPLETQPNVRCPDVRSRSLEQARAIIRNAGLVTGNVTRVALPWWSWSRGNRVIRQNPLPDTSLPAGSRVALWVSEQGLLGRWLWRR